MKQLPAIVIALSKPNFFPKFLLIILWVFIFGSDNQIYAQQHWSRWVDSVYNSMSLEQRISQLMIMRAWSYKDSVYNDSLDCLVQQYQPGGFCFFKGSPTCQANLVNRLQNSARIPLMIAIDAEWGLGMRLDSAFSFPRQMALGAIHNDSMIYEMGKIIGQDCRRLGVQFNFAPVADVNNNPQNPVISFRSFGEKPELVAAKSVMYMKGMQDAGIMTAGKHFPGHGDTGNDSHLTLPVINHDRRRLDSVELYPFKKLIENGIKGIMVAHLYVPQLDTSVNVATTLSNKVITGLLRNELGFKGFIITDALDMQGVTKYHKPGEIEVKALEAGNDILLLPQHIDKAIAGIKTALDSGRISPELIENKCKRILTLKESLGLSKKSFINTQNLVEDLNSPLSSSLENKMVKQSLTLLGNNLRLVPLTMPDKRKIACLNIGTAGENLFQKTLSKYAEIDNFTIPTEFSPALRDSLLKKLNKYDVVICGIFGISSSPSTSFGISPQIQQLSDTLTTLNRTILVLFGTPYSLNIIKNPLKAEAVLVAYQDNDYTQADAAEALFGAFPITGKLPVSTVAYPYGSGSETEKYRLETAVPEEAGISSGGLAKVDSIALAGISNHAFPGCQVLFAKDGRIFYEKSFGKPTYDDSVQVGDDHIFDLASVTKVAATTLAIMKLYDQQKITLQDTLGKFLPELKGSNKSGLTVGDVMAHQAGLQDWIPFYKSTLRLGEPDSAIYRHVKSDLFSVEVCDGLYLRRDYPDTVLTRIIRSPLRTDKSYKYSDLGFYLLKLMVEKITHQSFTQFLDEQFYLPLGIKSLTFNPLKKFPVERIIPTEDDQEFRKKVIRGTVHDPGAAMLGGISGHAGLFGSARDLAVILQMLLNGGDYGNKNFLSGTTVAAFTQQWNPSGGNRRAPGFDKPPKIADPGGSVCKSASPRSFGHSGFTGTYIWADPSNNLIYIFLSNRVYPDANNQKLSMMNIRTNIHQVVYDLFQNSKSK